MKATRLLHALATAAAVAGLAACSDLNTPSTISDANLATDLASSSGDAMATDVNQAVSNEVFGGFAAPAAASPAAASDTVSSSLSITRTKVCYDAQGAVVTCGQGASSMKITVTLDGSRSGPDFSGAVHRARTDSISGLGSGSSVRTHNGFGSSHDTTSFTHDGTTRDAVEASADSIVNLQFQLPHASHPWPISGQIIRNLNAMITITGKTNETRTISRRVVITFPADAQGNVSIQVGTLTCNLNLVTHKVTNCTGS